ILRQIIQDTHPDACLHLGGIAFVPMGWSDPEKVFSVNLLGTIHLLEAFRALSPATRVLVVSSAELYGKTMSEQLLQEDVEAHPDNLYAVSKLSADLMSRLYFRRYGMPVMTARPINHIGPGQSAQFVCTAFAIQVAEIALKKRGPFMKVGNLESRRDFLDVRDVARAYRLLLEQGQPGEAYNIASGKTLPVRMVLDYLCQAAQIKPHLVIDPHLFRPTDSHPILDTSKIKHDTGWQPEIFLPLSIRDIFNHVMNLISQKENHP
ncbi:MAG: GDP-mannose 4,6-dehydratase, partial [Lentisphaerota bacterium]